MEQNLSAKLPTARSARLPLAMHGLVGLALIALFWPLNWLLPGLRTHWGFFPLWLGYCLVVDALNLRQHGSSLLARSPARYAGLFLISAPAWWLFELLNLRLGNWEYLGRGAFSGLEYAVLATFSFSTVMPAVFGTAELVAHAGWVRRLRPWLVIRPDRRTALAFFGLGWAFLALLLAWPRVFFPLVWMAVFFILEPVNIWLGRQHIGAATARGDWRPVVSLFLGALICGFFWEFWNYYSFPKWIYHVPGVGVLHIFEMPLLGYGGYLPFAMELWALYHLVAGEWGRGTLRIWPDEPDTGA